MNLLKFIRAATGRTTLAPRPKGNPYIARIDIVLEGQVIRKIEMLVLAPSRAAAQAQVSKKIAEDIGITTKVYRAKGKR